MILSTRSLLVDVLLSESEEDHKRYSRRVDVYERGLAKIVDRATGEECICERRELVREERKQTRKMLDKKAGEDVLHQESVPVHKRLRDRTWSMSMVWNRGENRRRQEMQKRKTENETRRDFHYSFAGELTIPLLHRSSPSQSKP